MTVPPGWPPDLPPSAAPEFHERVTGWLLDRLPGGWRGQPALRVEPQALAVLAAHLVGGELEGLRNAYTAARRELHELVTPQALDRILVALEAEGTSAAETLRQVELVADALGGRVWRDRL